MLKCKGLNQNLTVVDLSDFKFSFGRKKKSGMVGNQNKFQIFWGFSPHMKTSHKQLHYLQMA